MSEPTTIYEILSQGLSIPVTYGVFTTEQELPFICILGDGQDTFKAEDTFYATKDRYTIEYYFKKKNPTQEASIESLLLQHGWLYEKSEDAYIEDEGMFVVYYYI